MPKRRTRHRRRRRLHKQARLSLSIVASSPVPSKQMVQLKYVEQVSINPGAASMGHFLFSANNLVDPNITGAGHQPMGFDQWMTFYNKFTVLKSVIKVTAYQTLAPEANKGIVGIYLNDNSTSTNSTDQMLEFHRAKWSPIGVLGSERDITTVTNSFSASRMFGRPLSVIKAAPDFTGDATTAPAEVAIYDIFVSPAVTAEDMGEVDVLVELVYQVLLTDRATLASS